MRTIPGRSCSSCKNISLVSSKLFFKFLNVALSLKTINEVEKYLNKTLDVVFNEVVLSESGWTQYFAD